MKHRNQTTTIEPRRHNQYRAGVSDGCIKRMLKAMQRGYLAFRPIFPRPENTYSQNRDLWLRTRGAGHAR